MATFGCLIWVARRASRRNRAWAEASVARSWRRILTTRSSWRWTWRTRYTSPMPPVPSGRTISYFPSRTDPTSRGFPPIAPPSESAAYCSAASRAYSSASTMIMPLLGGALRSSLPKPVRRAPERARALFRYSSRQPPPAMRPLVLFAPLAGILALGACARPNGPVNLVLVTVDTLRRDHVGAYGDRAAATPALDRLAREGLRFDAATSNAPLTLVSHASLLS